MSEPRVIWYSHKELNDPIAVVGFPSVGLVSSIVTSYVARDLELEATAGIAWSEFPPYTLVQNSRPLPPVRIFAGPVSGVKTRGSRKKDVVIVTSEMAPKPEQTDGLTTELMGALNEMGVREILCIEGIPGTDPTTQLMGVGSTEAMRRKLADARIPVMQEGLVRGVTGVMLYEGAAEGMDVSCLLCPANPQLPDPGAAAGLVEPLMALIPGLKIDTKPLLAEADAIEKKMREQQAQESAGPGNIYG